MNEGWESSLFSEAAIMQRWGFFSMGIMAGIIVVLLSALIMQNREPLAYAAAPPVPQAADAGHEGLIMGIGASQQNQNDICWVLFKRSAPRKAAAGSDPKDVVAQKDERISLAAYQIANGGRGMKLAAVRDISFDLDILELANEKPSVKDIVETLRKQQPKDDKPK
jgi:hypothetical protein